MKGIEQVTPRGFFTLEMGGRGDSLESEDLVGIQKSPSLWQQSENIQTGGCLQGRDFP